MVDSDYESSDSGESYSGDGSNWGDDDDYEEEIDEGGDDTEMYTAIRDDESDEGPTDSYTFWPPDAGDM